MTAPRASILQEQSVRQRVGGEGDDAVPFSLSIVLQVSGPLDPAALASAVREVQTRHEALRSHFALTDDSVAIVVGEPVAMRHEVVPASDARSVVTDELAHRFDLLRGPLFRPVLVEIDPASSGSGDRLHYIVLVLDHLIGDGWSLQVILRDLAASYAAAAAGRTAALPDAPTFSGWAAQQRASAAGDPAAELAEFWSGVLPQDPQELEVDVPGWRPADPQQPAPRCAGRSERTLGAEHLRRLRRICAEAGTSPYVVFAALLALAVTEDRPRTTLPLRSNTANRLQDGSADVVGYLTHEFVLPVPLAASSSFAGLLDATAEVVFECLAHDRLPLSWTSRAVWGEGRRGADRSRQLYLMVVRPWVEPVELPGCEVRVIDEEPVEPHRPGLELWITPGDAGIQVLALYSSPHYEPEVVDAIVGRVADLLVADPTVLDARVARAGDTGAPELTTPGR